MDKKNVPQLGGVQGTSTKAIIAPTADTDKGKSVKARHWAGIVYPESMPENWKDIITASHVPCVMSPLHDKDVNPDGTPKKPHYHIMFCYPNTTTGSSASHILAQLGSSLHAERVMSAVGNYRYLTHRDNPEKAQYSEDDIQSFNGFSYTDYIGERTLTEKLSLGQEVMDIVMSDACPPNYIALIQYLQMMGYDALLEYVMTNTYFVKELLASKRAYNTDVEQWERHQRHKALCSETAESAGDDLDGTEVSPK